MATNNGACCIEQKQDRQAVFRSSDDVTVI